MLLRLHSCGCSRDHFGTEAMSMERNPLGEDILLQGLTVPDAGRPFGTTKERNPLEEYEFRCPLGGESSVVLYCTSLRGIRKTFEDCHNLQMTLSSFGVVVDERDVSMHSDFRTELKQLLEDETAAGAVPRLFIKGRYIGEARKAHDEGKLVKMLEGIPKEDPFNVCDGLECSGSCKLVFLSEDKAASTVTRCPDCNENGLIRFCCCCCRQVGSSSLDPETPSA